MTLIIRTVLGSGTQSVGSRTALDDALFLLWQQRIFQGRWGFYPRTKMPAVAQNLGSGGSKGRLCCCPHFLLHLLHHLSHKGTGRLAQCGGSPSSPVSRGLEWTPVSPCFLPGLYVFHLSQQVLLDCSRKGLALRLEVDGTSLGI